MQGYLRRPTGVGPFPAVVLLHGCAGYPEPLDQDWGVNVASWGYVTLTIDSFGPRGIKNACSGTLPADVVLDAYRGLNFLVRQPFVDPKRIFVVGFSQGVGLHFRPSNAVRLSKGLRTNFVRRRPSIHLVT